MFPFVYVFFIFFIKGLKFDLTAMRMKEIRPFTRWMDFAGVMLSEKNQSRTELIKSDII